MKHVSENVIRFKIDFCIAFVPRWLHVGDILDQVWAILCECWAILGRDRTFLKSKSLPKVTCFVYIISRHNFGCRFFITSRLMFELNLYFLLVTEACCKHQRLKYAKHKFALRKPIDSRVSSGHFRELNRFPNGV